MENSIDIPQRYMEKLRHIFPGGFRVTGNFSSIQNCSGYLLNYFFPKTYPSPEVDLDINRTFRETDNSQFLFRSEYDVIDLDKLKADRHFKEGSVIAFVHKYTTEDVFGKSQPNRNVNHVANC